MEYFGYILLAIVILLFMVLIHELGHYTAAKILGFTVDEFSVGFGPKLFGRRRKNGELFSLRALPLGGYCAFMGENDDEETEESDNGKAPIDIRSVGNADANAVEPERISKDEDLLSFVMRNKPDEDAAVRKTAEVLQDDPPRFDKHGNPALPFNKQKPWKRIIVLLGGVTFNFISAIIFSLIYIWSVGFAAPQIVDVYTDAEGNKYSDFQKGDVILAVNGTDISVMDSYSDLTKGIKEGQTVKFKVDRGGKIVTVSATRRKIETTDEDGKPTSYVGFGMVTGTSFIGATAGNAFKYCVPYTFKLSWSILGSFGQMITGKVPITSVTGPIGSVKLMADISIANWRNILILLPLLASNLAMFNLLPFPALDGAQVIFTVIEWIRKKPIKRKIQSMINAIGLITLLLFVLIVDILSFAL